MIAIISILAGMLMPGLSNARKMGRRTECANNLRQLFIGMTLYANENDSALPSCRGMSTNLYPAIGGDATVPKYLGQAGVNLLYPRYVADRKVYICPVDLEIIRSEPMYFSFRAYRDLDTQGLPRRLGDLDINYRDRLPLIGDAAKTHFHKTGYNTIFWDGHAEFVPANFDITLPGPYQNFYLE